jgi:2-oxoglutarate ferredoxin oxidoreductase subunit gamma
MYQGVLIAGFGGQGVVSAGILLTYSGMVEDKYVTFFPSYGAEMRGGTANCSVVISDQEVASPVIAHPDSLIVMNEPSLTAFEASINEGGLMLLNSSLISSEPQRKDIETLRVPANDIAAELGSPKSANMVMIGAYCKKTGAINLESVFTALPKVFLKANEALIAKNIEALKKGAEAC